MLVVVENQVSTAQNSNSFVKKDATKEPSLVEKIERMNQSLVAIGSTSPVIVHDVSIEEMFTVQTHFIDAEIKLCYFPKPTRKYYLAISIQKVKLISVDCMF